ncbi:uncharacterized protein LOC142774322 [Rhipicephalus microplus]|uniref:uncharacterized protein LOC142774322 n=1 Tax=Rhipicephalus microplus TaxID=6941 RepID=UPI003F6D1376
MTLDLYSPGAFRHGHKEAHCSSLLPSPVPQMLVLSTPELEQFITFNGRDPIRQPQQPALQEHATSGPDTSDSCDWISSDSLNCPLTSEPQAAPTDMRGTQDVRLEQRRERSQIRASMYRQQYLALISALEAKVDALKSEKTVLEYDASILSHKVRQLYEMVMMHVKEGCKI